MTGPPSASWELQASSYAVRLHLNPGRGSTAKARGLAWKVTEKSLDSWRARVPTAESEPVPMLSSMEKPAGKNYCFLSQECLPSPDLAPSVFHSPVSSKSGTLTPLCWTTWAGKGQGRNVSPLISECVRVLQEGGSLNTQSSWITNTQCKLAVLPSCLTRLLRKAAEPPQGLSQLLPVVLRGSSGSLPCSASHIPWTPG